MARMIEYVLALRKCWVIRENGRKVISAFILGEVSLSEKAVKSSFNFNSCGEKINCAQASF